MARLKSAQTKRWPKKVAAMASWTDGSRAPARPQRLQSQCQCPPRPRPPRTRASPTSLTDGWIAPRKQHPRLQRRFRAPREDREDFPHAAPSSKCSMAMSSRRHVPQLPILRDHPQPKERNSARPMLPFLPLAPCQGPTLRNFLPAGRRGLACCQRREGREGAPPASRGKDPNKRGPCRCRSCRGSVPPPLLSSLQPVSPSKLERDDGPPPISASKRRGTRAAAERSRR